MGLIVTLLYPIFAFLNTYKWYLICAALLYLVLVMIFKRARVIITILFGLMMLFFLLTHLGGAYGTVKGVMTDLASTSQIASAAYAEHVTENILPREDLTPAEKLERALTYGLTGNELDGSETLPTGNVQGFGATWKLMFGKENRDAILEGATDKVPLSQSSSGRSRGILWILWSELKELVGIHW